MSSFGPSKPTGPPVLVDRRVLARPTHASTKALLAYWQGKCPAGDLPRRDQILANELRPLLPNLGIIEPVPGTRDWLHRLVGTQLVARYGNDPTGKRLSEVYGEPALGDLLDFYQHVATRRAPAFATGRSLTPGVEHVIYEGVALPILGRDEVTVWLLIGLFFHN